MRKKNENQSEEIPIRVHHFLKSAARKIGVSSSSALSDDMMGIQFVQ
jgi:hypothetical protein